MHEWRPRETPVWYRCSGFFLNVFRPNDFARRGFKAKHIAPLAQNVEAVAIDGRRAGGAAFVVFITQFRGVGVLPNFFASGRIEAPDSVFSLGVPHGEDAALRDNERRKAQTNFCFPGGRRTRRRPGVAPAFFGGDSIARGAAPLRPVFGAGRSERKRQRGECKHQRTNERNFCCHALHISADSRQGGK